MKTRDRILATALQLFNDEGIGKVSTNRVAEAIGISPGNLYYHFKNKAQIAERLFTRLELDSEALLKGPTGELKGIDDLWLYLHLALEQMFAYRCFYRDFDLVATEYPGLAPRMQVLTARGIQTVREICLQLTAAGMMQASTDDIDAAAFHMVFIGSCWFSFARMLPPGADASTGRAAYQVLSLLTPYLEGEARGYMDYLRSKYLA